MPKNDFWSSAFGVGCLLAVLGQGFLLGGLLSNLKIQNNSYLGGIWTWFDPASIMVALAVVAAYVMLGALQTAKKQGVDEALKIESLPANNCSILHFVYCRCDINRSSGGFSDIYLALSAQSISCCFSAAAVVLGYSMLMLASWCQGR